ncbi:MAG: hypothetical protein ACJAY1_002095, partial [Glaciecola sp.]
SELDRPEQEFVELLRQCQQRVLVSTSDAEVETKPKNEVKLS